MISRENETRRIKDMVFYLGMGDLQDIGRVRKEDFTRNCIFTIPILVFIALNKHSQTLTMDIT
ncbi:MAG: hypothetical protein LBT66_03890 [Methanobrevibacter sp.]|jgi:hypothetical protein|nr:hypothetical protein [Candidatus Methanovirga meridionalis]